VSSVLGDPALEALLERLHARSEAQVHETSAFFERRAKAGELSWEGLDPVSTRFMADKLVALEPPKAEFCYLACRALEARRIVEIGTSFGVSTLYLAAAVRDNGYGPGEGVVVGTEHEPGKAAAARAHFEEAGLASLIELREGDLRETLRDLEGPIDFVLMDIWVEMARPAIELVGPRLRRGGVVCADNTENVRGPYRAYFDYIGDPANGFRTMTLPFAGGLEMTVKVG